MDKDFSELLSLFDRYGVKYLVVGGFAVIFYSQPRGTKDIDLYVDSGRSNIEAVYRALAEFGVPLANYTVEDLQDQASVFQIGVPPLRIDILKQVSGLDFSLAWQHRVVAEIDGVKVAYIGRDDLVRNKRAAGRLQDLADVEAIETAQKAAEQTQTGNGE